MTQEDMIVSLIGLVTAVIPLVLAILALYSNRTIKTIEPLETQSFLVLNIIRIPVEEHTWKKYKRSKIFKFSIYITINIFVTNRDNNRRYIFNEY